MRMSSHCLVLAAFDVETAIFYHVCHKYVVLRHVMLTLGNLDQVDECHEAIIINLAIGCEQSLGYNLNSDLRPGDTGHWSHAQVLTMAPLQPLSTSHICRLLTVAPVAF